MAKCQNCRKTFEEKRADARACSAACKQALYRSRIRNVKVPPTATEGEDTGALPLDRKWSPQFPGKSMTCEPPVAAKSSHPGLTSKAGMWRFRDRWGELHYFSRKPDLEWLSALQDREPTSGSKTAARNRESYRPDPKILKAPKGAHKGELGLYAWPA